MSYGKCSIRYVFFVYLHSFLSSVLYVSLTFYHLDSSSLFSITIKGHYATGVALAEAGVVSANDMTVEAISCKAAYLLGRGDLSMANVGANTNKS